LQELEHRLPGLSAKVRFFETPQLEISSSTIRQRIRDNGHFRYYLPQGVYDYIQQNNLYHTSP
jgi:nicotinate-nucleotide adenylyltransferase